MTVRLACLLSLAVVLIAGCAYRWPSPRFSGIRFTEFLLKHDATGVAFNPPREVFLVDLELEPNDQQRTYELMLGKDLLVNLLTLF